MEARKPGARWADQVRGPLSARPLGSMIKITKAHGTALRTRHTGQKKSDWWNVSLWLHLMLLVIYRCRGFLRASKSHGRTRDTTGTNSLAVTQHNDNKNRVPQVSFNGTAAPLKLLHSLGQIITAMAPFHNPFEQVYHRQNRLFVCRYLGGSRGDGSLTSWVRRMRSLSPNARPH